MASALNLGGLSGKELGKRVGKSIGEDDVFGRAAQLAYYFFLALFPMVLFLLSVVALATGKGSPFEHSLMSYIGRLTPPDASHLIQQTIAQTFDASGGFKTLFAIVGALWAASQGVTALMDTLNTAYNARETRPFWKQRGLALWITVAASVLIFIGLALLTVGQAVASHLAAGGGIGAIAKWVWFIAQWPVMVALLLTAFGIIYYWAPNVEHPKWHWVTPGAITALVVWIIASFGLRYYLEFFNTYSRTYGALTAVIIILLWFYVTGAAILIGGEVNSEIEKAGTASGRTGRAVQSSSSGGGVACAWCGKKMQTMLGSELDDHLVEEHTDRATPEVRRAYEERHRRAA